mmetsp:Transcript_54195/g.80470  ORF Transcript_54195/g.80470 Transcript_54195/m.80470 type:complete len:161 (-) Transcript_54195:324-806(-)
MLFAANVVDGLVHQLGGWRLAWACNSVPNVNGEEKCPVGHAVSTSPGGSELCEEYDEIVHTVPPFYEHHPHPEKYLSECYSKALSVSFSFQDGPRRVASPLLGAGGRGFPIEKAVSIAATESVRWRESAHGEKVLAFGIPELTNAERLIEEISRLDECED